MFDLESVISIIREREYQKVVLQFVDEFLPQAFSIYSLLQRNLPKVDLFICGDSTWGSSADDISAQHVKADILIYFGADLSQSSVMPIMIVPPVLALDVSHLIDETIKCLKDQPFTSLLILYDPSYFGAAVMAGTKLPFARVARLPQTANLIDWPFDSTPSQSTTTVGGLKIDDDIVDDHSVCIVYIGEQLHQLQSIEWRLPHHTVWNYIPSEASMHFRSRRSGVNERYGSIHRISESNVIGIIIGSMGMDNKLINSVVCRLQTLIVAAKKHFYTFVMGRINESKLCNFPEVDIYCLVANDAVSIIKPKTFPVPVVTPFELEVGLGARSWDASINTNLGDLLLQPIQSSLAAIKESRKDFSDDEDRKESVDSETINNESSLMIFDSAAAHHFDQRTFKGLGESSSMVDDLDIHLGSMGIAAHYSPL